MLILKDNNITIHHNNKKNTNKINNTILINNTRLTPNMMNSIQSSRKIITIIRNKVNIQNIYRLTIISRF